MKIKTLKNREDFLRMNKNADRWVSKAFILQALQNEGHGIRAGFTVTKKTEKSAVARNRIKRRLRETVRLTLPQNAKTDHDFVLIGKSAAKDYPFENLQKDLIWCLKRLDKLQ